MIENQSLVALGRAALDGAEAQPFHRRGGNEVEEDLHSAHVVEVVVESLRRLRSRYSVHEVQGAKGGLHLVRRHDLLGDLLVESRSLVLRVSAGGGHCGDEELERTGSNESLREFGFHTESLSRSGGCLASGYFINSTSGSFHVPSNKPALGV